MRLAPGDYAVTLRGYDYGDGRTRTLKVSLGDASREFAWHSQAPGFITLEEGYHLAQPADQVTVSSAEGPQYTSFDFLFIRSK